MELVQFPFAGGLDEKTAEQYLDPGTRLASVVNGNFTKVGAVDKRAGMGWLGNNTTPSSPILSPTTGQRLVSWSRSDLTVIGSGALYQRTGCGLEGVSDLPPCYALRRSVAIAPAYIPPVVCDGLDFAGNPLRAVAYTDPKGLAYLTVLDGSGGMVLPATQLSFPSVGAYAFVVNVLYLPAALPGHRFVVFATDGGTGRAETLYAFVYDDVTNSVDPGVPIVVGGYLPEFEVAPFAGDPAGGFIVQHNYSEQLLYVEYFLPSLSLASSQSISLDESESLQGQNYCVATYGEQMWTCYTTLSSPSVYRFHVAEWTFSSPSFVQVGAAETQAGSIVPPGGMFTGAVRFAAGDLLTTFQYPVNPSGTTTKGLNTFGGTAIHWLSGQSTPGSHRRLPIGFVPMTRPFMCSGTCYQPTVYRSQIASTYGGSVAQSEQATLYLLDVHSGLPVATAANNIVVASEFSSVTSITNYHLPLTSAAPSGTNFAVGVNTAAIDTPALSGLQGPSYIVDFFFDASHVGQLYEAQELGDELHVSGAVPVVFDGQTVAEENFFYFPEFSYATLGYPPASDPLPPSAPGTDVGYSYAVCYAAINAAGLLDRSAPAYIPPINPGLPTSAETTGTVDITQDGLYGPNGALNLPATCTGSVDITTGTTFGPLGSLAAPCMYGNVDISSDVSGIWGPSGTIAGRQLELTVDSEGVRVLTFGGSNLPTSFASFQSIVHAFWPSLTAALTAEGFLVLTDSTTGPYWLILVGEGDANGVLGLSVGFQSPAPTITFHDSTTGTFVGHNGQISVSGSSAALADIEFGAFVSQLSSPYTTYYVGVVGSSQLPNTNIFAVQYISSSTVTVSAYLGGQPSPAQDATATDAWAVQGFPCVRVLTIYYNGALTSLALYGSGNAATQGDAFAAIESAWPGLTPSVSSSGHLVLTSPCGPAQTFTRYPDTANTALGLTPGTYTGSSTTLVAGGETITFDVATNATSMETFLSALTAAFSAGESGGINPSVGSGNGLHLSTVDTGVGASFALSGTACGILGLTPGTYTGSASSGGPIIHVTNLTATYRSQYAGANVVAEIYRTTLNGSVFFLVDTVPINGLSTPEVIWPSNSTSDNTPDSEIQSSTLLYTTGGVVPNINPPASLLQISHNGRIARVDETRRQVWMTQAFSPGTAPGSSGALVIPFVEGGDITALASMDGKLFVFKEGEIWVMFGSDGPALTAQGSDWTVPQRVSSNVGAQGQEAIVSTDAGVFFQASTGIYLLGRDLAVSYVGKSIVDTLAEFPTIASAAVVPNANQVRFTCNNSSSTITIAYDYLLQQWTTHEYPYLTAQVASTCLTLNGQLYTLLTSDGQLWQESSTSYMDQDTGGVWHFVPTVIRTASIKTAGLQGFQRAIYAQLYSTLLDAAGIQVSLAINYDPAIVQTSVYPYAQLLTSPVPGQVVEYVAGRNTLAMAYQFTVSDVDPGSSLATTGQGARFIGLGLMLDQVGKRYPFVQISSRR